MSVLDSPVERAIQLPPARNRARESAQPHRLLGALRRVSLLEWLVLAALTLWTVFPLALQIGDMLRHGGAFTGGVSFDPPDLFQYLWWVRDSGTHLLISDPFQLAGPSHGVFLQPMFVVSGLLWRLGLSLPLAYFLPWAPVSVLLTFIAFRRYVRRHVSGNGAAAAALVLALFYFAPAGYLAYRTGALWGGVHGADVDGANAFSLWQYFPRTIAIALVPLVLLWLERTVNRQREPQRYWRLSLLAAVAMAITVAWMHPWQGAELVIVTVGFIAWSRPAPRVALRLLAPVAGAALPLLYYQVLQHYDEFWRASQTQLTARSILSPQVILLAFLPLCALALAGFRRRLALEPHRRLLFLWLAAALIVYFGLPARHGIDGALLPLSILAVQGWQRIASVRLPARLRGHGLGGVHLRRAVAVAGIAACTIPGGLSWMSGLRQSEPYQLLSTDDFRALSYLQHASAPGGVLASMDISPAVPVYTGRNTFSAQFPWTPQFSQTSATDLELYAGRLSAAQSEETVELTGARFLLVSCLQPTTLPALVSPLITSAHRFGCAAVYELRAQPRSKLFPPA